MFLPWVPTFLFTGEGIVGQNPSGENRKIVFPATSTTTDWGFLLMTPFLRQDDAEAHGPWGYLKMTLERSHAVTVLLEPESIRMHGLSPSQVRRLDAWGLALLLNKVFEPIDLDDPYQVDDDLLN